MGCLFPKGPGLKEYWRLLFHGEDGIGDVPETHWLIDDYFDEDQKKPDHVYCKRGGFLSPVSFDPAEFGIPPSSLEATDTSQLLGLVVAKMAMEDAGYGSHRDFNHSRTSVILGVTGTQELVIPLSSRLGHPIWRRALQEESIAPQQIDKVIKKISESYTPWQENSFPGLLGNVVSGRISNRLDLGGTNCTVDAACASSMSAIHLATMELSSGRSDMVITGGVDTLNDIFMHMCFSKTHILSPTGDVRPFSKDADGTLLGEGIGMLILKRLEDAEKEGDRIYAVIKSIGTSSDGKSQSIYAPNPEGQEKAIRNAYQMAAVDPSTVDLFEAHGTGTRVGDFVEFQALNNVFSQSSAKKNTRALGSVKSMIGHTKAAAGAAGMIKTILSLYNKVLLPTLKADNPDPNLKIDASPFYLNTETRPWFSKNKHPRRSGVSAFGFGGSNFHVVLEEYQKKKEITSWDCSVDIVALSAPTPHDLAKSINNFKKDVEKESSNEHFSISAAISRHNFSIKDQYRLLLTIDRETKKSTLFSDALKIVESGQTKDKSNNPNICYSDNQFPGKIGFLFPGQGSQYIGMGRDLVCTFADAFAVLEDVNKRFHQSSLLSDLIYPRPARTKDQLKDQELELQRTDIAQPAIGAISLSMLKILQGFGVKPEATGGHSYGELTALHAAEWIDYDTFFHLSILRGQHMANACEKNGHSAGGMLALFAPLDRLTQLVLDVPNLILSNHNSPDQGVLSGLIIAIKQAEAWCKKRGLQAFRLPVSGAFHSKWMKSAGASFQKTLKKINIFPSNIPVFSNTTGKPYPHDMDSVKDLLSSHLSCPVDFVSEIENLFDMGIRTFVEVGPRSVLTKLVKSILNAHTVEAFSIDHSEGTQSGMADLARTLCRLASLGHFVDLKKWEDPVKGTETPLMSIPISGVNYKEDKRDVNAYQPDEPKEETLGFVPKKKNQSAVAEQKPLYLMQNMTPMEEKEPKKPSDVITDSLRVVQEGLKSMQALHQQTAEAHKKFLETQIETSRTLQAMMEQTQRFAEATPGYKIVTDPVDSSFANKLEQETKPSEHPSHNRSVPFNELDDGHPLEFEPAIQNQIDMNIDGNELEAILLGIVSEKTGYPVEMIGLDMDLEADLGIDSIKRVEILSVLEEKIPELPVISPEIIGSFKTLEQIVAYLSGNTENNGSIEMKKNPLNRPLSEPKRVDVQSSGIDLAELTDSTLMVVSEKTGYPVEMIGLDMDLEADLGIDSIKRVEILSALEEKIPELPVVSPEIIGSLKTLKQIVSHLSDNDKTETSCPQFNSYFNDISDSYNNKHNTLIEYLSDDGPVSRKVISIIETQSDSKRRLPIPNDKTVFITDDGTGLSKAIESELASFDIEVFHASIDRLKRKKDMPKAFGLIILPDKELIERTRWNRNDETQLKNAFLITKRLAPDLIESAKTNAGFFATVTRMDGAFGFHGKGVTNPLQGGLAGLVKTVRIEWENVFCRAFDVSPMWKNPRKISKAIVSEILNADRLGPVEIGLDPRLSSTTRYALTLNPSPLPPNKVINTDLDDHDVLIVTGGARGITASALLSLTSYVKPTLILLGRSPAPTPEPHWLTHLRNESEMKTAIFKKEFNGHIVSPRKLEERLIRFMANREISNTLNQLEKKNITVRYYSVDIRNISAVRSVLDEVRSIDGPIRGIIHGAGVVEDRLIIDKTAKQFENVFDTKVKGIRGLLKAAEQDHLKYLIFFSSIVARMGNKGQADYAMANEVLNKVAWQESLLRPKCSVISFNWGPWDGGMVTPGLKREFARKKIEVIPVETGVECMLHEMSKNKKSPVEVVVGSSISSGKRDHKNKKKTFSLSFKHEIDVDRYPILSSHILDGKPVVPFALMTEWIGHGALHDNPGLFLFGIDNMRVFNAIRLEHKKMMVRLLSGKARKKGSAYEVDVELMDGLKDKIEVIHTSAKAILVEAFPKPPLFNNSLKRHTKSYPKNIDEVYETILFHGDELRGIKKIISCTPQGMVADLSSAPSPKKWILDPMRSKWIGDPLVLDSAFQMATIWCFEEAGLVSLPTYSASYRQYRNDFPETGVTAIFEINQTTDHKIVGDFTFLDSENVIVACLLGYEAVMYPSLSEAFQTKSTGSSSR